MCHDRIHQFLYFGTRDSFDTAHTGSNRAFADNTDHTDLACSRNVGTSAEFKMGIRDRIWNAQIAQSLLKGAATVSFEMYDILKQQSNISRSFTADVRSVTEYNSICLLYTSRCV